MTATSGGGGRGVTVRPPREPVAGRRGTRNEERWAEVLSVAATMFNEKGYPATSLQEIASQLGMLKGSLYYYIDSKEDLLFDLLERGHLYGISLLVEDADLEAADAVTRLQAFVGRWLHGRHERGPELNVFERDLRFLSPERRDPILKLRRRMNRFVQSLVTQGVQEWLFQPEVDRMMVASSLFQLLNAPLPFAPSERAAIDVMASWYLRAFVLGLARTDKVEELASRLSSPWSDRA